MFVETLYHLIEMPIMFLLFSNSKVWRAWTNFSFSKPEFRHRVPFNLTIFFLVPLNTNRPYSLGIKGVFRCLRYDACFHFHVVTARGDVWWELRKSNMTNSEVRDWNEWEAILFLKCGWMPPYTWVPKTNLVKSGEM